LFSLRDELDRQYPDQPSIIVGVETIIWEHGAGVWLELSPTGRQRLKVEDFIHTWRERIGDIGRGKVDFIYKEGDEPYDLELLLGATNADLLTSASEQLKQQLASTARCLRCHRFQ
jgi:hypothetical protein